MRIVLPLVLSLFAVTQASWICPVFRASGIDPSDLSDLSATAMLETWEVVITPIPVTDEAIRDIAQWDYMICERLSMKPEGESGCILFCIDLGVVPEGCRELLSVAADGIEISPCSTLARPFYTADAVEGADTLYILRQDPFHSSNEVYVLDSMSGYRERFDSDDDFRSAVPETARFYAVLYGMGSNGEPFDVEVVYISRGWTYLTGVEPLRFSLLQPGLWAGPVSEASFLLDFTGIADREDWLIEFMGEEFSGAGSFRLRLEDFDSADIVNYPVLSVTPPDLQGW
jgi:hypothetical protein